MTDELSRSLKGFAEALEQAPDKALEAASIALNEGALLAEKLGRSTIASRLNLETAYIHKQLYLDKESSRTDLLARVRANKRSVLAPRFGAQVATKAATSPKSRLRGDPYRGIAKGQKAAGSSPWSVLQSGKRTAWKNVFFVNLKGSGAWAMVDRMGPQRGISAEADWKKNLKVIHGMSVDQAWRGVRDEVEPEAMALAERVFLKEFGDRL